LNSTKSSESSNTKKAAQMDRLPLLNEKQINCRS
jgi:hypothetical protein